MTNSAMTIATGPARPRNAIRVPNYPSGGWLTSSSHHIVEVNAHSRQQHAPGKPQQITQDVAAHTINKRIACRSRAKDNNGQAEYPIIGALARNVLIKTRNEQQQR